MQANGRPAPSYQWQFNGVNLAGQTNATLTLAAVQTNRAGTYSVVVTNQAGGTNLFFVLTVTTKPKLAVTEVMSSEAKGVDGHLDWWELSNLGTFPVNLRGYRFDDDDQSFVDAVTFTNEAVIAPGESVVFVEDMTPEAFRAWWGGQKLPPALQIIPYPAIGFGSDSDAVYLWNAAATAVTDTVASVTFATAKRGVSFGYNAVSNVFGDLSVAGQGGAFAAAVNGDIGSPGTIINLPRFAGFNWQNGQGLRLTFVTQSNVQYRVEYKENLAAGSWSVLTNFAANANQSTVTDATSGAAEARFYRVVAQLIGL